MSESDIETGRAPATPGILPAKPLWRRIVDFPLVALALALAIIAAVLAGMAFVTLAAGFGDLEQVPASMFSGVVVPLVLVLAYKLLVARLGEMPRDDLPLDRRSIDIFTGTLLAFVLMSVIVLAVTVFGGYRVEGWGGATSWAFILFVAGTQAAVLEEILFRGILFRFLEEFGGSWFALALSAALFGLGHAYNDNATTFSSLAIAIEAGILLGGAYMLTRNLWLAIGIHFGWNVTQGLLYDVPVSGNAVDGVVEASPAGDALISGGAFGLEASVVALFVATACGAWLVFRAARKGQVVRPWWVRRRLGLALPA